MDRREFLRLTGLACIPVLTPRILVWPAPDLDATPPGKVRGGERILILVELKGGNDGLNTVVPFRDERYYELRPRLAVPKNEVVRLNDTVGLHPRLKPIAEIWADEELALVLGVGYDAPNRSHFRSIEIWETGSASDEYLDEGWIARVFGRVPRPKDLAADGVILGRGSLGPLLGAQMRNVVMDDPQRFARQARALGEISSSTDNPALDHILGVRKDLRQAAQIIEERHRSVASLADQFPKSALGRQLQLAAELLTSKIPISVVKVALGSFDTHANQLGVHARLLGELAESLAAFRKVLREAKLWDRVLVMTYSEFGRRVPENASGGTDHGTAAPHLLLGGRVKGGVYGRQPSLDRLSGGDLVHAVDFRSLYATVGEGWWKLPVEATKDLSYPPLRCFRSDSPTR